MNYQILQDIAAVMVTDEVLAISALLIIVSVSFTTAKAIVKSASWIWWLRLTAILVTNVSLSLAIIHLPADGVLYAMLSILYFIELAAIGISVIIGLLAIGSAGD